MEQRSPQPPNGIKLYPDFKTFLTFVTEEANLVCNPIYSWSTVKEAEMLDNMNKGHKLKDVKEKKTILSTDTTEEILRSPREVHDNNCIVYSVRRRTIV